jgi:outer membrane lipoprotein-sorting protein
MFPPEQPASENPTPTAPVKASGRRRALRWLVPLGAAGAVAAIASGMFSATANPNLPPQTAAQLLGSIADAKLTPFSGTVVEKASLGLPELPNVAGSASTTGLMGMLSGSHTIRVWYAGQTKQRIAILDSFGEQDVFRNGRDLWQWDSNTKSATHTTLPAAAAEASPTQLPQLNPAEAARQALALIDPSTIVTTDNTGTVAGRSTYTLVLEPKDTRSRVGSVRISVDSVTKVPLGVQVIARGQKRAALDVSFTRVNFTTPDDDNFTFSPPAGVKPPKEVQGPQAPGRLHPSVPTDVTTIGSGWTSIAKITGVPSLGELTRQGGQGSAALGSLPAVSGKWGSGHLFTSALLSALITDDGRAYIGAVDPALLYQAAEQK